MLFSTRHRKFRLCAAGNEGNKFRQQTIRLTFANKYSQVKYSHLFLHLLKQVSIR